jgi:ubiquinone/menaquinone biosynthesis C-methylase UbiE
VTGVDLAPQMIDQVRRKARQGGLEVDFRIGNAVGLDCADETYDLVVARHVIWNLPDPEQGLAEWLRSASSPGTALC